MVFGAAISASIAEDAEISGLGPGRGPGVGIEDGEEGAGAVWGEEGHLKFGG